MTGVVIMAGGKGTRLRSITRDEIPKPMAKVCGKPILEHQILSLKRNGFKKITLIIGYLGQTIKDYFGDGSSFGVNIDYIEETEPLGTAGAFYYLKKMVAYDNYIIVFGDTIFDIDVTRMLKFHNEKRAKVTLMVHPNSHPFDSDLIIKDTFDRVTGVYEKNTERNFYYHNLVNAGFYIIKSDLLQLFENPVKTDLDKDIIRPLIEKREVFAYSSSEYIKDAGTADRIASVEKDMRSGKVESRSLKNSQKCVFLDRDGTINRYNGFLTCAKDFELLEGTAQAVKIINDSGWLCCVVTNQPVIARGDCSLEQLDEIHAKMETLLGAEGAYIDETVFCPHHPHKGFAGERPEYKVVCNCRKPATGMIDYLAKKYHIVRQESILIGDSDIDRQAGKNAGIGKIVKIESNEGILETIKKIFVSGT